MFLLYLALADRGVDWAYGLACFVAAAVVVGALVGLAALLRVPWWLLAPFCLLSLALEAAWRKLAHRPWQRRPAPRRWYLSNAVAVWQRWALERRRRARRTRRSDGARHEAALHACSPQRPTARVLPFPAPAGIGVVEYALEAWEGYFLVWYVTGFTGLGLWLA